MPAHLTEGPRHRKPRPAVFPLLAVWLFLCPAGAFAEVITTVNIDSTQVNQNPSGSSYFLQYNKPANPVEPYFRVNSATVHSISATSNLTYSLWGVIGATSSQLGANITSVTPTGNQDVITDLTGFGSYAYASYDSFILQITGVGAAYSTATGAFTFTSGNANVVSSGLYVGANNGTGTATGPHYLWLNTSVSAVPEPGTLALGTLATLGGMGGWWSRGRKRRAHSPTSDESVIPTA